MKITFDSNVWERVINREEPHFVKINNKIREGKIEAYICHIALSLEAIKRRERPKFFENYKPCETVEEFSLENGTLGMQIGIGPSTEQHPGIPPQQWGKLLKARDLGFKVLIMTNLGTARAKVPDDMRVEPDDIDEFCQLLAKCSNFIIGLGCGQAAYNQFKAQFNLGDGLGDIPSEQEKKFSDAIAEWVAAMRFRHTTQRAMTSFVQTTRLEIRELDPYFMLKIGRNWKKRLVSKSFPVVRLLNSVNLI